MCYQAEVGNFEVAFSSQEQISWLDVTVDHLPEGGGGGGECKMKRLNWSASMQQVEPSYSLNRALIVS